MRGANDPLKHVEFKKYVLDNKLCCFALMETKLDTARVEPFSKKLWPNWGYTHNTLNDKARIATLWNKKVGEFSINLCTIQLL